VDHCWCSGYYTTAGGGENGEEEEEASLSVFVGNAVMQGDPCAWHDDADPATFHPASPWSVWSTLLSLPDLLLVLKTMPDVTANVYSDCCQGACLWTLL
jgi:hypothetical protein